MQQSRPGKIFLLCNTKYINPEKPEHSNMGQIPKYYDDLFPSKVISGAVIIKHLGDLSDKRKADRRKRVLRLGPYTWFRLQPFRFLV